MTPHRKQAGMAAVVRGSGRHGAHPAGPGAPSQRKAGSHRRIHDMTVGSSSGRIAMAVVR